MNEIDVTIIAVAPSDEGLTDWANEPKLSDLKLDYENAQSDHDTQEGKINTWLSNFNADSDDVPKSKERSSIVPRLIRKQAEWRYASLSEPFLSTEDVYNVYPTTYEDKQKAEENAMILNYQFNNQIDKVAFIDRYVRALVNEGTAIIRVGWDFEEKLSPVTEAVYETMPADQQFQQVLNWASGLQHSAPEEFANLPEGIQKSVARSTVLGYPVQVRHAGTEVQMRMKTIRNQPSVEVCDYRNVTIDPSCAGNYDKANFVVYSFETSKSELEKEGRYSNLDKLNAESAATESILNTPDHEITSSQNFNFVDDARKRFVAHEYWGYWDTTGDGTVDPIVATWVGSTLIRMERSPYPDGKLPFVVVPFMPVKDSPYGEPDGELLIDNQKIVGATTRGMVDILARSANGQMGVRKDMLDTVNRRKFKSGEDYEFNANVSPQEGFFMHKFGEIPNSAMEMLQLANQDAETMTGVKAFATGSAAGGTATAVKGALDSADKRELGILRRVSKGIIDIGYKIMAMNSVFLSEKEQFRISNDRFIDVSPESLAGRFDIKLSISTTEADNLRAQELSFMLQTLGNSVPFEMTSMILAEIAKLRNMPTLAKRIESYKPQPDPIAVMQQKLEMVKMLAEIEVAHAQAQHYQSSSIGEVAQARYDVARARNTDSDTDLKNLEYVEEESGVNHQRDLQKMDEQSKAQAGLKIVESMLNSINQPSNS